MGDKKYPGKNPLTIILTNKPIDETSLEMRNDVGVYIIPKSVRDISDVIEFNYNSKNMPAYFTLTNRDNKAMVLGVNVAFKTGGMKKREKDPLVGLKQWVKRIMNGGLI